MTRKHKKDELELQKQQIKNKQELENTSAMKTKRFSDGLKGALIKMSSDPVEVASLFRQIDDLYRKFEVPKNLHATVVKLYLNNKAQLVVVWLDSSFADDYKLPKEAIMVNLKLCPHICWIYFRH